MFLNRGVKDYKRYTALTDADLLPPDRLGNIDLAVSLVLKHIENNSNIHIVVDSDVDGYTSASLMYRYLKQYKDDVQLSYSIHSKKQHGLSDDIVVPGDINLLIIPDAGSSDVEPCRVLKEKGIDILILDHHEMDVSNPYATVVNSQLNGYPNRYLSGAGVVYKLIQALDGETWENFGEDMVDIAALGIIADVMDIRTFENRRLTELGLSRIRSKFFKALIEKQEYSMGKNITINGIQFYIVPLINALIRVGDSDEKDLLFRAFIETDEVFDYKKRGTDEIIKEDIYTRVARICVNAKAKQDKASGAGFYKIVDFVKDNRMEENKTIFANVSDIIDESQTGVVAMKVADYFGRPAILLRRKKDDNEKFGGSVRIPHNSPVENFRDVINDTGLFIYAQGHQGAFGVEIEKNNIPKAIENLNKVFNDIDFSKFFAVDFLIDYEDLTIGFIKELDSLKQYYCTGIEETLVHIANVPVDKDQLAVIGKDKTTWKFITDENISFIKFKNKDDDVLLNLTSSTHINVVSKCGFNNFRGIMEPQIIVLDYDMVCN